MLDFDWPMLYNIPWAYIGKPEQGEETCSFWEDMVKKTVMMILVMWWALAGISDAQSIITIATLEDLAKIGVDDSYPLSGEYVQTADIDASSEINFTPIGSLATPFTGTYNGNGFKITGLTIDRADTDYQGLFGKVTSGTLRKIVVEGANIRGENFVAIVVGIITGTTLHPGFIEDCVGKGDVVATGAYSGGIIGYADTYTYSTNLRAEGTVTGTSSIGGITGQTGSVGALRSCEAFNSVTSTLSGAGKYSYIGGLIGRLYMRMENCFASGNVTTDGRYSGGGVGQAANTAIIRNCLSIGTPTGFSTYTGGFCGSKVAGAVIENCYYDEDTALQTDDTGKGTPLTTAQAKDKYSYTGWQFNNKNLWGIKSDINNGYPSLTWGYPLSTFADVDNLAGLRHDDKEPVIANYCEDTAGFSASDGGPITIETTLVKLWKDAKKSVKYVPVASGAKFIYDFPTPRDVSDCDVILQYYISPSYTGSLRFFLGWKYGVNSFLKSNNQYIPPSTTGPNALDNGWCRIKLPTRASLDAGGPVFGAAEHCSRFLFSFEWTTGDAPEFVLDAVLFVPKQQQTHVCLSFDDGVQQDLLTAAYLKSKGIRGTFCINPGLLGTTSTRPDGQVITYLTEAEVAQIASMGHLICNYTYTHFQVIQAGTDLGTVKFKDDIVKAAQWLNSRGYHRGARILVMPRGGIDFWPWSQNNDISFCREYADLIRMTEESAYVRDMSEDFRLGKTVYCSYSDGFEAKMKALIEDDYLLGGNPLLAPYYHSWMAYIWDSDTNTLKTEFTDLVDAIAAQKAAGKLIDITLDELAYGSVRGPATILGDLNHDGIVNLVDFGIMAEHWLEGLGD